MRLSKIFWLVLLSTVTASAQFSEVDSKKAVEEKYLFPLKPGQPGSLAGTMGELRNTHFHSGIDIRTNNEIGWPVYASKSGYISRAGVSSSGFGNVLYITHPDGHTTLYGHLDKFNGAVGEYILKERYRRKTSDIDLFFREGQFPVKRGDTIAFAGNTGSSGGPHLHFDIRRNSTALDPLRFDFAEVRDITPPVIQKIALKTLDIHSRINDQFGRFEFYVTRNGSSYSLPVPILAHGNIGIELLGYDRVDNARYRCGINYIEVFVDSQQIFHQQIEEVNLQESRSIYSLIDYKAFRNQGNKFYKLYIDDGNTLNFYPSAQQGQIHVKPDQTLPVKILAKDAFGNTSTVSLKLKSSTPVAEVPFMASAKIPVAYDIQENTLTIITQLCSTKNAVAFTKGTSVTLKPAYRNAGKVVYLFDLQKMIPDSISVCGQTLIPNIKTVIPHGIDYKFYSDRVDVQFSRNALFDTLYFNTLHQIMPDSAEIFTIGSPFVPLNRNISITLKPKLKYEASQQVGVYRRIGKSLSYEGGRWVNGNLIFSTREFGHFTIAADTVPPTIWLIYANNHAARLRIRDNLSGIGAYEATLNGKWLLMNYDAKSDIIMSERLNKNEELRGDLVITVTDNAGNKKTFTYKIP